MGRPMLEIDAVARQVQGERRPFADGYDEVEDGASQHVLEPSVMSPGVTLALG